MAKECVDVAIIGAGQAGLAAARAVEMRGARAVLLEASETPCGSWPMYYDSLELFSPAGYSHLPGLKFSGDQRRYPHRDEVSDYLYRYASRLDTEIRPRHRVSTVRKSHGTYEVVVEGKPDIEAHAVVAATGSFGRPNLPAIPFLKKYAGHVSHVASYRNPEDFRGQRVLVVGAGNSAIQIGYELASVAHATIVAREPVRYLRKRLLGQPIHFWQKLLGFDLKPAPIDGKKGPLVVDDGTYRRAIQQGRPDCREIPVSAEGHQVLWKGGASEHVDSVLLATGYRPDLGYLREVGVLSDSGHPLHTAGISNSDARVAFVGLANQRTRTSAMLRGVGLDAEYVASVIGVPPFRATGR